MSTYSSTSPSPAQIRRSPEWLVPAHHSAEGIPAAAQIEDESQAIFLGESLGVRRLRAQVERIAPYLRTALLRGEHGTGKRLVARALHQLSAAHTGPFISCPASSLAEALTSESASQDADSLLDSARGGTLYLEDAGELNYALQAHLLRFLADRDASRSIPADRRAQLARTETRTHDTLILAATHRDLRTLSSIGQYRPDLYARLSAVEILTPPLRQRTEDMNVLADWLLRRFAHRTGLAVKVLSETALRNLSGRPWAGNLRELEQVVTHAAALSTGTVIESCHLPPASEASLNEASPPLRPAAPRADRLDDVIHEHVLEVLTRCGGNKLRAAELLGISRSTLYRILDSEVNAKAV